MQCLDFLGRVRTFGDLLSESLGVAVERVEDLYEGKTGKGRRQR